MPIPTEDLRSNVGTWAVSTALLPAIASFLRDALPPEDYDQSFNGQALCTTYFDTKDFDLRKARHAKEKYLVLRLREYPGATTAISAKTEDQKFRVEVTATDIDSLVGALPQNLQARLMDLAGDKPLVPVVTIKCRRYAVEDDQDRFTLDCDTCTDAGKEMPFSILEYKSNTKKQQWPLMQALDAMGLRPIKMSKFLWSTSQW
jgi:hypothetical protein